VHDALKTLVYDKGQGTDTNGTSMGTIAHTRGMVISMLTVEAIRTAQEKYGKGKSMTTEQVRWGLENLNLTQERLNEIGFGEIMRPVKTSCMNHTGDDWARIIQWDGAKFEIKPDWYRSDATIIAPLVKEAAAKYAKDKNLTPVKCEG